MTSAARIAASFMLALFATVGPMVLAVLSPWRGFEGAAGFYIADVLLMVRHSAAAVRAMIVRHIRDVFKPGSLRARARVALHAPPSWPQPRFRASVGTTLKAVAGAIECSHGRAGRKAAG